MSTSFRRRPLRFYVFDLLYLDREDLRRQPLIERKRQLQALLPDSEVISFSAHVTRDGADLFRTAQRRQLEGIMAKLAQGFYYSGKRTREWLKIKTGCRQEAVVVGFTAPKRSRKHFGALVLAVRDGESWRYLGHVSTGFNALSLESIHTKLRPLIRKTKPLRELVPHEGETTWVMPQLVCEVKFTEWTANGQMRHPTFIGLRTDKAAKDVVREREAVFPASSQDRMKLDQAPVRSSR